MTYRITGLPAAPFRALFGLSTQALAAKGISRHVADTKPGYPDRIQLREAEIGERVLLLNHTHQPADTPYRSSHAIFVIEGGERAYDRIDAIPEVFRPRVLSLRAFDAGGTMVDADLVDGVQVEALIARLLANPEAAYLHAHYAKRGCYAARIDRA